MARSFKKLTRPNMRKLDPEGRIVENGIVFERLPDGDGRFFVKEGVDASS